MTHSKSNRRRNWLEHLKTSCLLPAAVIAGSLSLSGGQASAQSYPSFAAEESNGYVADSHGYVTDEAFGNGVMNEQPLEGEMGPLEGAIVPEPEPPWAMPTFGADCGYSCPPRWYVEGDAMFLKRDELAGRTLSRAFRLPEFDFQTFGRITVGHTLDCLDGWEATYVGGGLWREAASVTGTNLQSRLVPGSDLTAADFTAFNNATFHFQQYDSELHSLEYNRRWWGWDVFSVKLGARYIRLDEEYVFVSVNNVGSVGALVVETDNDFVGPQLGIDMMQPYGRLTVGAKLNGAVGINFNDGRTFIQNGNNLVINAADDSEELGYLIEGGFYSIYRVTQHISLHAGYEGWFIGGMNLAGEQINGPIDSSLGLAYDEHGDFFVHGAVAGVELVW